MKETETDTKPSSPKPPPTCTGSSIVLPTSAHGGRTDGRLVFRFGVARPVFYRVPVPFPGFEETGGCFCYPAHTHTHGQFGSAVWFPTINFNILQIKIITPGALFGPGERWWAYLLSPPAPCPDTNNGVFHKRRKG